MTTAVIILAFLVAIAAWLALEWRVATAKPELSEAQEGGRTVWRLRDRRRGVVYEFEDRDEAARFMQMLLTDPSRTPPA